MEVKKNVLVIEDDESFRESLKKLLEKEGFTVKEASSGEEGLQRLDANSIDLVILDLFLGGMTGLEVLDRMGMKKKPPVILLTAFGDWGVYSAAIGKGAVDCLAKPVKRNELMGVISSALGAGKPAGRNDGKVF